jgi:hypothetical protein
MTAVAACRFCHEDFQSPENPFLSPCDCKGSVEFVHTECLRRWRTTTTIDVHRTHCQMCKAPFQIPRRLPLETWPGPEQTYAWQVLSQTFLITILAYYTHMCILLLVVPPPSPFIPRESSLFVQRVGYETRILQAQLYEEHEYERHAMLYRATTFWGAYAFLGILSLLTVVYGVYYASLMKFVVNREEYVTYFGVFKGDRLPVHPLRCVGIALLTFALSRYSVFPFGALYIYNLISYMKVHQSILRQINIDGDIL